VTPAPLPAALAEGLRSAFRGRLNEGVPLAAHTSARIGGPADFLLVVRSSDELEQTVRALWQLAAPFRLLGGGSNVLVADAGVRGGRLEPGPQCEIRARAGGARSPGGSGLPWGRWPGGPSKELIGLEWGVTVPGTIEAVVGNAGAHGGDTGSLKMAEILHGRMAMWSPGRQNGEYGYRTSWLKRRPGEAAVWRRRSVSSGPPRAPRAHSGGEHTAQRKATQPPGASMGSMFKNRQ
jgi:UDP-N-acetylmuramate dehydrogenase